MLEIAIHLRAMQLSVHVAHHLCARSLFFGDHSFLGEAYDAAAEAYDAVIERAIGLYGEKELNLQKIITAVAEKIKDAPSVGVEDNRVFFSYLLKQEQELCSLIEAGVKGKTQGTITMLGDIASASEVRQYKIKQRIAKLG
jgi:DNA-binding ferritin-like protein